MPQQQQDPSFKQVWDKLPFITRHLTLGAGIVFLLGRFEPRLIMRLWYWKRVPIESPWSVFTSMLAMRRDPFNAMIGIVMFWMASRQLEEQPLKKRSDLVLFYGFIQSICLIVGPSLGIYAFLPVHSGALSYTQCQQNPSGQSMILGLVPVTNAYVPWLNAGIGLIIGGLDGFYEALLGIFIGHLFLFLTELVPMHGGPRLKTPQWLRRVDFMNEKKDGARSFGTGQRLGSAPPKKKVQPTLDKKNE